MWNLLKIIHKQFYQTDGPMPYSNVDNKAAMITIRFLMLFGIFDISWYILPHHIISFICFTRLSFYSFLGDIDLFRNWPAV